VTFPHVATPLLLYVAAAIVVLLAIAFALDLTRRRHALERIGHPPQLMRMMASLSLGRRVLKAVLVTAGLSLAVAALARPQIKGESSWRKRGIDVALVMDFSKSMLARDVHPSRHRRMTEEAEVLMDELTGDRIAVVLFGGAAVHFPLTHDHEAARLLFEGVTPLDLPPGSDLGEGILAARCVVRPDLLDHPGCERVGGRGQGGAPLDGAAAAPALELSTDVGDIDRARAIVVFTDGEDTEGRAAAEIQQALELGVEVYLVGVGTTAGELIPELDASGVETGWKKSADGKSFVTTRLEEGALKDLARAAGGEDHYFRLDARGVEGLLRRLRKLKKGDLDERVERKPEDVYQWLLFPAFMLLLIEACLSDRRRRP
jgi:Ca-activated chloride channel family protein